MSINVRFLMLAIVGVSSSPPADCLNGACGDPQRESSVLMQRLNRKGRQMPLKVAKQAAPVVEASHDQKVADLYEVTVDLLKANNTTKPVLLFVQDMVTSLEQMIFPALKAGVESDTKLLVEVMNTFHVAESTFDMHISNWQQLVQQEEQAGQLFDVCRDDNEQKCDAWSSCETERIRRWNIYEEIEYDYQSVVRTIKRQWCEEFGDRSEAAWRESTEHRFEHFITIGEERITKFEAHDEWSTRCTESNRTLLDAVAACAQRKRQLEETSCQRLSAYHDATSNLDESWGIAKSAFSVVVTTIKGKECYRANTFKFLQSIKCIQEYMLNRCKVGEECDRPAEANEILTVLDDCDNYSEKESSRTLSPLETIVFPPVPGKPVGPERGLLPCSGDYVSSHYANVAGPCFASMPGCLPCGVAPSPSPSAAPALLQADDPSDEELNAMAQAACGDR